MSAAAGGDNLEIEMSGGNLDNDKTVEVDQWISHSEIEDDDYERALSDGEFVDREALEQTSVLHCINLSILCRFISCDRITRFDEESVREMRRAYGEELTTDEKRKKRVLA